MLKTVMVYGLGLVGGWALHFLGSREGVDKIVTSDRDEESGLYKTDVAAFTSNVQGFDKKFEFYPNDINDIDATARLLEKVKPDVILLSVVKGQASPQAIRAAPFSQDIRDKVSEAGLGAWLPLHLDLPSKFMQALGKSGIQTHLVNASYPDLVNPVLWKHFGFGPTVGGGNQGRLALRIVNYVSRTEGVPVRDVTVYLVSSHALAEHSKTRHIPFFLKIVVGDRDITSKYDSDWLIIECPPNVHVPVSSRLPDYRYSMVSAQYTKNVMAILGDTNEFINAPGPKGLIGGYPTRLSRKGAEIVLPKELTLEQAIKINEESCKFDGIERVKNDGTIVFTDKTYSIMKELGYDCKELTFDELESRSNELEALRYEWTSPREK